MEVSMFKKENGIMQQKELPKHGLSKEEVLNYMKR